jgi:hypothetical protein
LWHRGLKNCLGEQKKGINEENAPGSAGDFSSSTMMNARYSKTQAQNVK